MGSFRRPFPLPAPGPRVDEAGAHLAAPGGVQEGAVREGAKAGVSHGTLGVAVVGTGGREEDCGQEEIAFQV